MKLHPYLTLKQLSSLVVLLLFLPCTEGQTQVKKLSPVELRASDVRNLIRPAPGEYEKYFSKDFLAQVSPEKLTAIFTYYSSNFGRCLKAEPTTLASPLTGAFNFIFEKSTSVPVEITVDAAEPHLITGLWLGNAVSLSTSPPVDDVKKEFKERELTFAGVGGLSLRGTLLLPVGAKGKVPGVLLLPGSGQPDRNGNVPPVFVPDLLKQIAERLAKEGYASLRFDKRATPGYAKLWPTDVAKHNDFFSWDSFVGDAKAGLAFLQAQPEVDGKRVLVAGHSEGGMIAMQIGHDLQGMVNAPAGLILISTPGRAYGVVVREQWVNYLKRNGVPDAQGQAYLDYIDLAVAQLEKDGTVPPNPPPGLAEFPANATKLLRAEGRFDPNMLLSALAEPVLVLQGEKDTQVSPARDTPMIESALKQRKHGTYEVYMVPSASHNLKKVENAIVEPGITGPVVREALDKIATWMKRTFPD